MRLTLPLPPSVNSYWRSVPAGRSRTARVLISEAGRAFKRNCRLAAQMQCAAPIAGEVRLSGTVYFRDRRRDLDNVLKPLLDALQGVVYDNDNQVGELHLVRAFDKDNPRVELAITPLAELRAIGVAQ